MVFKMTVFLCLLMLVFGVGVGFVLGAIWWQDEMRKRGE